MTNYLGEKMLNVETHYWLHESDSLYIRHLLDAAANYWCRTLFFYQAYASFYRANSSRSRLFRTSFLELDSNDSKQHNYARHVKKNTKLRWLNRASESLKCEVYLKTEGSHAILVDPESENWKIIGLEMKFPELREFVKGSKGRVDTMLKIDSMKTMAQTARRP